MSQNNFDALREFVEETRDHLAAIEPDLLLIEERRGEVDPEIVNRVFRAIHSTKGGASFLGVEPLTRFSHAMEHVLARLRDGDLTVSSEIIDVLLRGVDVLRTMVDDIEHCANVACDRELHDLERLVILDRADPAPKRASTANEPSANFSLQDLARCGVEADSITRCLAQGMLLYVVDLNPASGEQPLELTTITDKVEAVGRVLGHWEAPQHSGDRSAPLVACATVLDRQMLATELGIEESRLLPLDVDALKRELNANVHTASHAIEMNGEAALPVSDAASHDSLRVRLNVLNRLMNVGGELVLARNQLLRTLEGEADRIAGLPVILQSVDRLTSELQESIMQTRMQPVALLFSRYPRLVRDLARQLGKEVTLHTSGTSVELDRTIVEALVDPLTHIIRNSISHGIETPSERRLLGKTQTGNLTLSAHHGSGHVTIEISDDGRGINLQRVVQRALKHGILQERDTRQLTEKEMLNLVMQPGVSTAEEVSDISGRGVGLDVVRNNIESLGGHVDLSTQTGRGTTISLRLPLTLAIIPALIVGAGGARFVVPQSSILELVWVQAAQVSQRIEEVDGIPVLRLRGQLLPLVRLTDVMRIPRNYVDQQTNEQRIDRRASIADRRSVHPPSAGEQLDHQRRHWTSDYSIVVVRAGSNPFGMVVDELYDSEEIVIKPLPAYFKPIECFAGTAILGDGRVTMILDPNGLAERAGLSFGQIAEQERRRVEPRRAEAAQSRRSIILVDASPGERLALPQESVLRVERIERHQIQRLGNKEYIQYRTGGLTLVRLEMHLPVSAVPADANELFVILPKAPGHSLDDVRAGIVVWRVLDAVDVGVDLQPPLFDGPGMVGSGIVEGHLTNFFDPVKLADAVTPKRVGAQG